MNRKRYLDKGIVKIGFFDIETQGDGFNANRSFLVSWVLEIYNLKTKRSQKYHAVVSKKSLKHTNRMMKKHKNLRSIMPYDKELLEKLIPLLKKCDMIVTHYGSRFDIPMIRTRCAMQKIDFIKRTDNLRFCDTWQIAKFTGKYQRNTLDNIARTLQVKEHKTDVDYWHWKRLGFGDRDSIKYVLKHNYLDVTVTKRVWFKTESAIPIPNKYY